MNHTSIPKWITTFYSATLPILDGLCNSTTTNTKTIQLWHIPKQKVISLAHMKIARFYIW